MKLIYQIILGVLLIFTQSPSIVACRKLLNTTPPVHRRVVLVAASNVTINEHQSCLTGNQVDDCWKCDPNWANDLQNLADCAIGFGQGAAGGKGGQFYKINDSSDSNVADPKPGTLRHAVIQTEPLWITFPANMEINLSHQLIVGSSKTIDGRGANISITGKGCITIKNSKNVIIHNIHVYGCVPSGPASIRSSPTKIEKIGNSGGDGISIIRSQNIWVDHCTISDCAHGLVDAIQGSTNITVSNNHFKNHDKVMLLGDDDNYMMQVTIAFNRFGEHLTNNMPLCRNGNFHILNNDYTGWKKYAVGGNANSTIISKGNRYSAPNVPSLKQVTKLLDVDEKYSVEGNDWRSVGDEMLNGAYFATSTYHEPLNSFTINDSTVNPISDATIDKLTEAAGVRPLSTHAPAHVADGGQGTDTKDGLGEPSTSGQSVNAWLYVIISVVILVLAALPALVWWEQGCRFDCCNGNCNDIVCCSFC